MPTTEEQLLGGSSSKRKLERLERSWNNGQIYLRFTYCNRISLAKSLHLMNEDAHVSQQDEQDHPPYPALPSPSPLNPRAQVKHSRLLQSILTVHHSVGDGSKLSGFEGRIFPSGRTCCIGTLLATAGFSQP